MEIFSQSKNIDRQPVAAGRFYSSDAETLKNDLGRLFLSCKKSPGENVRALICPHAGYVFSGRITASGFSSVSPDAEYKNIFIIGSSHVMAFEGASVYWSGDYLTPLGRATVNREIAEKLRKESRVFNFPTTSHDREHSIEVQVPFIQYYFKNTPKIVPVIIGTTNSQTVKKIADALSPWFTDENLFVISSDFSHYPSYEDANESDRFTADAIISGDAEQFLETLEENSSKHFRGQLTSMCGWTSGLALLYLTGKDESFQYNKIDYCNSGDSQYGNKTEVVGYHAISVTAKKKVESASDISFTEEEKDELFRLARNSIKARLDNVRPETGENPADPVFHRHLGAFVTLKINGSLRGCIGQFTSSEPLYEVVKTSAISSAFGDPRFPPLTKEEYGKVDVEITVLGEMKKIRDISEIVLGRHGIYIRKDGRAGTMLPQVATEQGWTVREFLGYTSRDKVGIGYDGWKDAEIFIYEGVVLDENRE